MSIEILSNGREILKIKILWFPDYNIKLWYMFQFFFFFFSETTTRHAWIQSLTVKVSLLPFYHSNSFSLPWTADNILLLSSILRGWLNLDFYLSYSHAVDIIQRSIDKDSDTSIPRREWFLSFRSISPSLIQAQQRSIFFSSPLSPFHRVKEIFLLFKDALLTFSYTRFIPLL